MKRPGNVVLLRTVEDLADAKDLRSAISLALSHAPIVDHKLRCAVWNFVGVERRAGVSVAVVIARLTELVDAAPDVPLAARLAITKQVILWCVEEYFGHLGGDVWTASSESVIDAPSAEAAP